MSILSLRSAEVFGALIEQTCPELKGRVCSGPSTSGHKRKLPSIAIVPISWKFSPDQEEIWKGLGSNRAVFSMGRMDALFQLQIGSKNPFMRAKLEDAITQMFFQREGQPGLIIVDIPDCNDAIVTYEFEKNSWKNEAGFSDKWFSVTTINVVTPVLVERGNVYEINEIRTCLRAQVATSLDEVSQSTRECVSVDEAGNVTMTVSP